MDKNVTYLFGAGASYNALPLVIGFRDRFKIFCNHLSYYFKDKIDIVEFSDMKAQQNKLIENIRTHYTVDTYAKKLFLKNPKLNTNKDYGLLTNYLSAYFIYEQLKIDIKQDCNKYLRDIIHPASEEHANFAKNARKILQNFDYRYDSFLASILKHDKDGSLIIPKNINFISWNYDFQIEKAYMNFSDCTLNSAMEDLNVFATPQDIFERPATDSHLIKLNGTAAFLEKGKFGELFDFSKHSLDDSFFEVCKKILLKSRQENKNGLRFSWEESSLKKSAIELAAKKIEKSDIVVVIGYSFPYFNRDVDRAIFESVSRGKDIKIYIQCPNDTINSVMKRFKGVVRRANLEEYTETDQFLIPNEL